jgi:hypothetical protein
VPRRDRGQATGWYVARRDGGAPVDLPTTPVRRQRFRMLADLLGIEDYPRADMPERALMRAVLEDATRCYLQRRTHPLAGQHAENWFRSSDSTYLYDFERICLVLDFAPDYIRRKLLGRTGCVVKSARQGHRAVVRIDAQYRGIRR